MAAWQHGSMLDRPSGASCGIPRTPARLFTALQLDNPGAQADGQPCLGLAFGRLFALFGKGRSPKMKRVILALAILMALVATGASLAVEHSLAAYPKPLPANSAGAPVTTGTPTISPTPLGTPVLCPPEIV